MKNIFYRDWESIAWIIIVTVVAYVILIILLRASGKRTLSKMNSFDFIVTIAIGSMLGNLSLNENVPLINGIVGLAVLIYLQYLISYLAVKSTKVSRLIKSTPSLLVYKGELLSPVMKKERISEDEIYAVVREKGYSSLKDVDAIVLETDGSLTLISQVGDLATNVMKHINKPVGIS